jgi:carbonic anhydrase
VQQPYAAVLACSDARVPPELVFQHASNELFVARVAGNVLGSECLGSIEYAVGNFESVRLLVVLGHSGCGAVTAAVDAYLHPTRYPEVASTQALRCIVDAILVGVRSAAQALHDHQGADVEHRPGYGAALVETAVALNAAMTAWSLRQELTRLPDRGIEVVFGVYDLVDRLVGLPIDAPHVPSTASGGLRPAPREVADFAGLAKDIVTGRRIGALLESAPPATSC